MARVVSISQDLMLGSRVEGMLGAAGHEVVAAPSIAAADIDGVDLVVADLEAESGEALGRAGVPVLGYYSHVDVETRRAAEAAGVEMVVPRSKMARELPALVERLLAAE